MPAIFSGRSTGAHRVCDLDQIEFIGNIVRRWRGEQAETNAVSEPRMADAFPDGNYRDVSGVWKVASRAHIEGQNWSLN
jgi:type I restriction enzyme M protein